MCINNPPRRRRCWIPRILISLGRRRRSPPNRTANAVTLTTPVNPATNMVRNIARPRVLFLIAFYTNLTAFDAGFPSGNYVFNVQSTTNQQVTVNLNPAWTQPNAPYVTNYALAQAINPAQAFRLGWSPFVGGTAAEHIHVSIDNVFNSPAIGEPGALTGTANSVVIPAGTLQAGNTYSVTIGFYRASFVTNISGYATTAYRATQTQLSIAAAGGTQSTMTLTNAMIAGGKFRFEVLSAAGQSMVIESATVFGSWLPLLVTNSPAGRVLIVDPRTPSGSAVFYRARKP